MFLKKSTLLLSSLLLATTLSACDNRTDVLPPVVDEPVEQVIEVTPPEASVENEIDLPDMTDSDNVITEDGYAAYQIGASLANTGLTLADNATAPGSECAYARVGDNYDVLYMFSGDELVRIDVSGGEMSFDGEVGIGSTAEEIESAFDGLFTVTPGKYDATVSDYTVKFSDTRGAVFHVTDGQVTSYQLGRYPEVSWIEGCA